METDRKRGRRKLPSNEIRDTTIKFRVNEKELAYLNELKNKAGIELGHLIRQELLKSEPRNKTLPKISNDALLELKKIGNNINQMTKILNSKDDVHTLDQWRLSIKKISRILSCLEGVSNEEQNKQKR
ncbi:plasmid mobilization protein [Rosenbergiella epipactidis]|uniref:plasmid mobilization protein n=1 Tax=Rosenbergiella epipactidis TaxID=1544694 RepID=UPI001F4E6768|nr:plasmid mobilization relaxosome protein MobC [Rosenbergiella epipactidis]